MAEISRNSRDNTLEIYKGFHKSRSSDVEYIPMSESNIEIIKGRHKIIGTKFNNFFEKNEIASYYAENEFKKILEKNSIKSIYLGMHFEMGEKDKDFYLNIGNSRPDFMVRMPETGNLFFDIKTRRKIDYEIEVEGVEDVKDKHTYPCFTITRDDVDMLMSISDEFLFPVWLVFKDYSGFDFKKKVYSDTGFYIVPVSVISKYIKRINQSAKKYSKLFYTYKIPVDIMHYTQDLSSLSFTTSFDKELIKNMADIAVNSLKEVRKTIFEVVSIESVYKTYLPYMLTSKDSSNKSKYAGVLNHLTPQDVSSVLWYMIDKNEIKFEKEKYLEVSENIIKK